jgi:putative phosphoesterase
MILSTRIFVAGDLHIPSRATMLHPDFQTILESEKWDYIFLTGDYTTPQVVNSFKQYLKNKKNLVACKGNMDQFNLPIFPIITINNIKFGIYHGTGISPRGNVEQLKKIATEREVQVLCTGHSHQIEFYLDKKHVILNPGTSTGASGGTSWSVDVGVFILNVTDSQVLEIELLEITPRNKLHSQKQRKKFLE